MEILKWLHEVDFISKYSVIAFQSFKSGFFIKIKANLSNVDELCIREYSDINERNYSYHWQNEAGQLICRWDNAPHHKELFNSDEVNLKDVLNFIERNLDIP